MGRLFMVGRDGTAIKVELEIDETEIRKEEEEFLAKARKDEWFKELLERFRISEREWLENCVKARIETIKCSKCKKRFPFSDPEVRWVPAPICRKCLTKLAKDLLNDRLE